MCGVSETVAFEAFGSLSLSAPQDHKLECTVLALQMTENHASRDILLHVMSAGSAFQLLPLRSLVLSLGASVFTGVRVKVESVITGVRVKVESIFTGVR